MTRLCSTRLAAASPIRREWPNWSEDSEFRARATRPKRSEKRAGAADFGAKNAALSGGNDPMADPLIFYTNPMSRGRIVRWMLEEVGEPYETGILDYGTTMKGADYLAINPMGKVPAISHGDTRRHRVRGDLRLSRRMFPEPGWRLRGDQTRPLLSLAVLRRRPSRGGGHRQGRSACSPPEQEGDGRLWQLRARRSTRSTAVANGHYICGDQFTAADVYVGAQIGWGTDVRH